SRDEYEKTLPALRADPKLRADALKAIGEIEEELGERPKALTRYQAALALVPEGYYLRKELVERIIGIHRKTDNLRALIREYEKSRGRVEQEALAGLYEEVGDEEKALAAYRKLVGAQPQAVEIRQKLIALLVRTGRSQEVIKEYERLVTLVPGEARFQLELAELYHRRGEKQKPLPMLRRPSWRLPPRA